MKRFKSDVKRDVAKREQSKSKKRNNNVKNMECNTTAREALEIVRNKACCRYTANSTQVREAFLLLKQMLIESQYKELATARQHYLMGEGREEFDQVVNSIANDIRAKV